MSYREKINRLLDKFEESRHVESVIMMQLVEK